MVRRLGLGKNNHLTYASLALNPRYGIVTYLQMKSVNCNLFMLFETRNLHFKNLLYNLYRCCHFVLPNEPECLRMYPTRKMKKRNKKPPSYIYFFLKKKVSENLKSFLPNYGGVFHDNSGIFFFILFSHKNMSLVLVRSKAVRMRVHTTYVFMQKWRKLSWNLSSDTTC